MVKRSSRIAKRDDFQNALATVEKAIGASLAKKEPNPAAVALLLQSWAAFGNITVVT
jgi:hypothetical protein